MKKNPSILLALSFLLHHLFAAAQVSNFNSLTESDGLLSNKQNMSINQTSDGKIWIGSDQGISIFNGSDIETYTGETSDMIGKSIQGDFFENEDGQVWFTTYEAIHVFDPLTKTMSSFQLEYRDEVISTGYRMAYVNSQKNEVWVQAAGKVFIIKSINPLRYFRVQLPYPLPFFLNVYKDQNKENTYSVMGYDWIRPGLKLWDVRISSHGETKVREMKFDKPTSRIVGKAKISGTYRLDQENTWLFSDHGILFFNAKTGTLTGQKEQFPPGHAQILDVVRITKDSFLISFQNEGVWIFDRRENQLSLFEDLSATSSTFTRLFIDREGFLWASTAAKGVFYGKLQPGAAAPSFTKLETTVKDCVSKGSDLFCLLTSNDQLNYQLVTIDSNLTIHTLSVNAPALDFLFIGPKEEIWGFQKDQLFHFNQSEGKWNVPFEVDSSQIFYACLVSDEELLLSTSHGLKLYSTQDVQKGFFSLRSLPDNNSFSFSAMFVDKEGHLYLAYQSKEVWICGSDQAGEIKVITKLPLHGAVSRFKEDEDGIVWAATTNGLYYIFKKNESFLIEKVGKDSWSIGNRQVFDIVPVQNDRIIFFSRENIWSYSKQTKALHSFSSTEFGIPAFNRSDLALLGTGSLLIPTASQLIKMSVSHLNPYPKAPIPSIDRLLVNGTPYQNKDEINPKRNEDIRLNHRDNDITIFLNAISFHLPKQNRVRYRLLDSDSTWNTTKNGSPIHYPDLPPGKYKFEYAALNANNISSPVKTLSIIIIPPIWQQLGFQLLVLVFVILIGYGLFRAYLQRKLREQRLAFEKAQAVLEERNRIADELHDDMGSGLSVIKFLSDSLLDEASMADNKQMERISRSAGQLLESMSDIVWALDDRNDSLQSLFDHIRSTALDLLDTNELSHAFEFPAQVPDMPLGGRLRRNILLVVKEGLHNILKHAEAGRVRLHMSLEDHTLHIRLSDNGKGFDPEDPRSSGRGLGNIQKRAEQIGGTARIASQPGQGTTIRVAIPLPDSN